MGSLSPENLITFSGTGFTLLFLILTIVPTIYQITVKKDKNMRKEVELMKKYPYRLLNRLSKGWVIGIFVILSLIFLLSALLGHVYILAFEKDIVLKAGYSLCLVSLLVLFFVILVVSISAYGGSEEIGKLMEYLESQKNN